MLSDTLLNKAVEAANKSVLSFKHGAILFKHKNIFSIGNNKSDRSQINGITYPSIHAEMDTMHKMKMNKLCYNNKKKCIIRTKFKKCKIRSISNTCKSI